MTSELPVGLDACIANHEGHIGGRVRRGMRRGCGERHCGQVYFVLGHSAQGSWWRRRGLRLGSFGVSIVAMRENAEFDIGLGCGNRARRGRCRLGFSVCGGGLKNWRRSCRQSSLRDRWWRGSVVDAHYFALAGARRARNRGKFSAGEKKLSRLRHDQVFARELLFELERAA